MTVFDATTHVLPALELVYEEGNPVIRGRWDDLNEHLALEGAVGPDGGGWEHPWLTLRREPGEPAWATGPGTLGDTVPAGVLHDDAAARLRAMDREDVDRQLVLPGPFTVGCSRLDPLLAFGLLDGYNGYIARYCAVDPDRLRCVLQTHAAFPEIAAERLTEQARHASVVGASVVIAPDGSYDDPRLEPLWAALAAAGLTLTHHEYASPPGVDPSAGAERLLRELLASGVLDRHPQLRVAITGCGATWLLDAVPRLRAAGTDPDALGRMVADGRLGVALAVGEPERVAADVVAALGEDVLLWGSRFPDPRSRYPSSPDEARGWTGLGPDALARMLAGNAERLFRRR